VLKLVERQPAPLDDEQVVAAALAAIRASDRLLDTLALPTADHGEFETIVRELAEAMHAALDWMPRWRKDDRQLHEALGKWLP
jgi:hypothetical protein